jgi:hypothetical protein
MNGPFAGVKKPVETEADGAETQEEGALGGKEGTTKLQQEQYNPKATCLLIRTGRKSKPRKLFRPDMGPDRDWFDDPATPEKEEEKCICKTPPVAEVHGVWQKKWILEICQMKRNACKI